MEEFTARLTRTDRPLLLDGATGTELDRRGVDTTLPLWSARALLTSPDVLEQIHRDYVAAGAEALTANTFRTHMRNLVGTFGRREAFGQARRLTALAVEIARRAADDNAYVLGSQAPLEDCYRPDLAPDDVSLQREHAQMAENLAEAGVDAILVETQNSIREAVYATGAVKRVGLPVLVSFVCGTDGNLLSGETLTAALQAILPLKPKAVLVNCGPTPWLLPCVQALKEYGGDLPFGAYGNIGVPDDVRGWRNTDAEDPAAYARFATAWLDAGATLLGGCCGTTPEHIRRLRQLLNQRAS